MGAAWSGTVTTMVSAAALAAAPQWTTEPTTARQLHAVHDPRVHLLASHLTQVPASPGWPTSVRQFTGLTIEKPFFMYRYCTQVPPDQLHSQHAPKYM